VRRSALGLTILDAQTVGVVITKSRAIFKPFELKKMGLQRSVYWQMDVAVKGSVDIPATILEKDKQGQCQDAKPKRRA
jgi:hypothetical protein